MVRCRCQQVSQHGGQHGSECLCVFECLVWEVPLLEVGKFENHDMQMEIDILHATECEKAVAYNLSLHLTCDIRKNDSQKFATC